MKSSILISCIAAPVILLLSACGDDGTVTEEAASEAAKVLRAWQEQNK